MSHNILDRQDSESPLEIGHKSQHSHDSGAYIDWNMEESYGNYAGSQIKDHAAYNSNVSSGFVTVVAVEQNHSLEKPPCPFVTVLAINDVDPQSSKAETTPLENIDAELVLLYRLPGERLGLGLKFDGGVKSSEKVDKLFIQSCAPNSPASRSKASWGFLAAGDEIMAIDEIPVNSMTRIECVRCLKESSVVIKLLIKPNRLAQRPPVEKDPSSSAESFLTSESIPPPVPPRKFRKNSIQSSSATSEALSNVSLLVHPPEDFADRSNAEPPTPVPTSACHKCKASPRALPRHTFPGHPETSIDNPDVPVYMDMFVSDETEVNVIESESDDTGSSLSTIIDRASSGPTTSNSSFSEVRSTTSMETPFDSSHVSNSTCSVYLDRVLEPFLQLEREFSSSAVIEDSTLFTKLVAAASIADGKSNSLSMNDNLSSDPPQISLQPPVNFQDSQSISDTNESHNAAVPVPPRNNAQNGILQPCDSADDEAPVLPPKPLPRKDIHNQKNKFKSGKKRPPPPPPPVKSDRPLPVPGPSESESSDGGAKEEEEGYNDVDHLPRLIDFVPKDRTDVIVPSAIHASAKPHQDHVEMLIERHKFLDIISTPNENRAASVKESNSASLLPTDPGAAVFVTQPLSESERCPSPIDVSSSFSNGDSQSDRLEFEESTPVSLPEIDENSRLSSTADETNENVSDDIAPEKQSDTAVTNCNPGHTCSDFDPASVADINSKLDEPLCTALQNNTGVSKTMDSLLAIGSSSSTNHSLPPPPSFSRLPPDGHEFPFPPNYQETGPIPLIHDGDSPTNMKLICSGEVAASIKANSYFNGTKADENSASPPRNFNFSNSTAPDGFKSKTAGSASWRNDEKSEKSVRDKIAMFSNRQTEQNGAGGGTEERNLKKMNRFKSSENVSSQNDFVDCVPFGSSASRSLSRSYMNVNKVGNHVERTPCQPFARNTLRRSPELIETSNSNSARNFILNSKLHSELDFGTRTPNAVDLTLSSSSSAYSSCSPESSLSPTSSPSYVIGSSCTLPRKTDDSCLDNGISTMTRATSFSGGMRPHNRSQSLVDVGNLQNRYPTEKSFSSSDTANRQTSLNNLIEQRRRSMSKLRGLVIPEKVSEIANINQTILDLPEIKTEIKINCHDDKNRNPKSNGVNYPLKNRFNSLTNQQNNNFKRHNGSNNLSKDSSHLVNLYSPQTKENLGSGRSWKSQLPTNEIPKYSPAFKRKSLTVCSKPSSNSHFNQTKSCINSNNVNSSVPLSRTLPQSLNPRPYSCLNGTLSNTISMIDNTSTPIEYPKFESKNNGYLISANKPKSKLDYGQTVRDHSGGGDSDSDSAVSSSRSSISPPMSPMPEPNCHHLNEADDPSRQMVPSLSLSDQKSLHRTLSSDTTASAASSTTSTLTSGSQASCSSNGASCNGDAVSKRVLKPQSVEAINRKNVLSSARYSCGLDAKIGSPLIQRKFVEDPANPDGNTVDSSSHDGNDFAADLAFLNYLEKTVCPVKNKSEEKTETAVGSEPVYHQLSDATIPCDENVQIAYIEITENSTPANELADRPTTESDFESEQSGSQSNSLTLESQNGSLADVDFPRSSDRIDLNGNCESKSPFNFGPKSGRHFEEPPNENDSDSSCPLIKKLSKEFNLPVNGTEHSNLDQSKADPNSKLQSIRPGDLSPEPTYRSDLSNVEESPVRNKFLGQDRKESSVKSVVSPRSINSHRSVSVNDIRKAFEKPEPVAVTPPCRNSLTKMAHHARVSSLDSTASDDSLLPPYGSVSNLHREQFGSISSLASSTSLISQQELQQLIDDANQTAEEAGGEGTGHEVAVIVLHRDVPGASIGITLAGGADYETKEITVHKVLAGSPADRDGRIQKGDRILSINGRSMKDATHREALSILKAPRFEVVLVVSHWRHKNGDVPVSNVETDSISRTVPSSRSFRKLIEDNVELKIPESELVKYGPPVTVTLNKDGAGLGFSLEGGKDSPLGDQALTVKKIFSGGCAEKCGQLSIGDELLKVNETDVTVMTRIEAWSLMKRLENGKVTLSVRHVCENKN